MEHWLALRRIAVTNLTALLASRRLVGGLVLALGFLVASELGCRALGLHTPVLYETTTYGYRVQPDQDIRRFGHHIFYNSFGMRSQPTTAMPAAGIVRVLCVGDSVTNGGSTTDQVDTYPYVLADMLRAMGRRSEVLNASAPGWATANEAGWLREHGTYGSRVVILTISTHDLFQPAEGPETVGSTPSFPGHAPHLGLEDFFTHYFLPWLTKRTFADPGVDMGAEKLIPVEAAVENILFAAETAKRQGATPFLLFVEQPAELERADPQVAHAKIYLFETLQARRIGFASTRKAMSESGPTPLFRDGLHPNVAGNRVVAQVALQMIASSILAPAK
jgi:lysophospholipase L1-like esterase